MIMFLSSVLYFIKKKVLAYNLAAKIDKIIGERFHTAQEIEQHEQKYKVLETLCNNMLKKQAG